MFCIVKISCSFVKAYWYPRDSSTDHRFGVKFAFYRANLLVEFLVKNIFRGDSSPEMLFVLRSPANRLYITYVC